jgi:hypothetical protein
MPFAARDDPLATVFNSLAKVVEPIVLDMAAGEDPTDAVCAERAERYKAYVEKLSGAPACEIMGVVDPSGIAGVSSPGDEFWTLRFEFEIWKIEGGELRDEKLYIEKPVSEEELGEVRNSIKAYDVVQIRARFAEPPDPIKPHALLIQITGQTKSDADLNRAAQKLREPVTFQDPEFGAFLLDKRVNWFEAQVLWCSLDAKLCLAVEDNLVADNCLEVARLLWSQQNRWDQKVRDCAASKLLKLRNDTWRQSDEEILNRDQFKALMSLTSVTVKGSGDFEFWFNDGDLFWGHDIMVEGNLKEGPTDAGIHG